MISELKEGAHIHLMGICGTAMASLAGSLKEMGFKITGSDTHPYPPMSLALEKLGIPIQIGYERKNLEPKPDFVIVGNVIRKDYAEAEALLESQIPYTSLPSAIGDVLIGSRSSFVVCGTHGKTTTTSMLAWMAECCEKKPGFLVGGIPLNFNKSFQLPKDDVFVIEGDEYDTAFFDKVPKFTHYNPKNVILTGIEFDHIDIYKDMNEVMNAFMKLKDVTQPEGYFLFNGKDKNSTSIAREIENSNIFSYGDSTCDFYFDSLGISSDGFDAEFCFKNEKIGKIRSSIFGSHNRDNLLATVSMAYLNGWDWKLIQKGALHFKGVKRRQEIIGEPGGITIIDDFAHHPTAVRLTLEGLREHFPNQKIFAIFEPRSATSRRSVFQSEYEKAFHSVSEVFISKIHNLEQLPLEDRLDVTKLGSVISERIPCFYDLSADEIVEKVKSKAKRGDVVIVMSNGGFEGIHQKLLSKLDDSKKTNFAVL